VHKSVTGVVALRSKRAAGKRSEPDWRVRAGLAVEGAYLNGYVTEEQRSSVAPEGVRAAPNRHKDTVAGLGTWSKWH
jgi:hypothetical protein